MRTLILLIFLFFLSLSGNAQIQYTGCNGVITPAGPHTLNPSGTTNDGGTIRNTYVSISSGCSVGNCAYRVIWSISNNRWEIQLSSDLGATFPNILYFNTSASQPNPPDLTLGTWSSPVGCGAVQQLTGDVQSSVGGSAPEINLTGNGNSILDGDVTPSAADGTDYGNVAVGIGVPQTFVIDNSAGTGTLNITNIVVTGAQAGDFVVTGAPATVAAGASANFTLTFTPAAAGTRTATVTINNNDADEGAYDFAVRGNGIINPEIDILGNGNSIADGDVTPSLIDGTDFGNVVVSSVSPPQTFVIDNSAGTSDLTITSFTVSGPQSADFIVTGLTIPTTIAAGASSNFNISFNPSAAGVRNATITINNNDADEGVYDFAVTGNGIVISDIAITEWLSDPSVDDATDEWVEVYNYGSVPVDIQNWRLRDEDFDNSIITTSSYVILPGDYVILARNKVSFENDWLNCPDSRVLQVPMILGNTSDEIVLEDNNGNVVWSIAYTADRTTGNATFYTENTYIPRVWGSKASPGIDRVGLDPATGTLGYQRNSTTPDPNARAALNGDIGSPLDGNPNLASITRGNVLDFDGNNDLVDMGNPASLNITNQITLEAWIFPRNVFGGRKIITKFGDIAGDDAYNLEVRDGRVQFLLDFGAGWQNLATGAIINSNQWHHIAATYDGSTMSIYVNGVLEASMNRTGNIDISASTFKIGGWAGGEFWDGQLEEIRVWDITRSATQIRENMHLTLPGCSVNLISYYQFNEAAGATLLRDARGNNDGNLVNMDPATDWLPSGVNVGNDNNSVSVSQTLAVAAGASTANFNAANASLNVTTHSVGEDFTVTYQAFAPNAITGITGTSITQNPMWTINKSTTTSTQTFEVTFTLPTATFNTAGKLCNFQLYHRPMYSEGPWTAVANEATNFTATTVTFAGINVTGQFLIVENPANAPDLTRGRALEFDGTNDQVIIGNVAALNFDFNTAFTLSAWVKIPVGTSTNGQILSKFDGATLVGYTFGYLGASGEVNFGITNFSTFEFFEVRTAAGFDIRDDQWHHVAVSYDGSGTATGADIYIDGVRSTNVAVPGIVTTSVANTAPAIIGNYANGSEYFTGQMDKLTAWSRNLSANEIREGMHLTFDGCETDLVAYYQMNEAPGATILNDFAGGSNGTLSGMNVVTSWVNSTVNLGNDAAGTSGSQTLLVPAGANNQTFGTANASIQFNTHSVPENYTVTYEAFTPNAITGIAGSNIIQNPMWTINKETGTSTQDMDLTFIFPASTFTTTNPCGASLYNRPMNSDGPWTLVAQGSSITPSSVTFNNITVIGQFLVTEDLNVGGDMVRGDVLEFDGIDDYVTVPHNSSRDFGTGDFTTECWFYYEAAPSQQFPSLLGWRTPADFAYLLYIESASNQLTVQFDGINYGPFGPDLATDHWHHVAVTRIAGVVFVYLNGVEVFTATIPDEVTSSGPLNIGWDSANPTATYFNGSIDEIRVWSVGRTATEIRENMHLTSTGCEAGLLAYYQFNDGAGSSILTDKTSNSNDGTLTNMDPATDWVASGVNVGNDPARTSNSQTLALPVGAGTRQANFGNANLFLELIDNTNAEDYTVTYEAFPPNTVSGVLGTNILQNPMWTINKQTAAPAPRMNLTFQFPAGTFTDLDATKYRLYWRPMYSEDSWSLIKNYAQTVSNTAIKFTNIYETGQFMVVQASELLISDVRGGMYDFNATGDYIDASSTAVGLPQGNAPFTVEAWVKTSQTSIGNFISWGRRSNNNRAGFAVRNSRLAFIGQSNDYTGNTIIADGEWHHVTIAYDGTVMRFYVDGILDINPTTAPLNITDQNLVLGKISLPDNTEFYRGSLDEVRIWNTARTQNEIRENMHLTLKGTEAGLIVYYQFNDDLPVGTPNGVIDAFGVANGTTVNMTANSYIPSEVAVAGGVSERMTVTGTGLMNFTIPKVGIDFTTNPDGEIVVSRLMTEKPHGWESITGDVDNEYFVVWNYGTNQAPVIDEMFFNELSYFTPSMLPSEVGLYKRGSRQFGPTWGSAIAPASSINTGAPSSATFTGTPLTTGFSQLVIAQTSPVGSLPIELLSFEAERTGRKEVQLRWTTASERDNKGFEVERLLQGETEFAKVATVESKGNNAGINTYYQVDPNSFTGTSYYRLKQLDTDGNFQYSPTRAVEGMASPNGEGLSVFPNPTQGALNFQILEPLEPQQVYISLTDAQGRLVKEHWTTISSKQVVQLPELLEGLPNNLYFLQVQTTEGNRYWSKTISLQ